MSYYYAPFMDVHFLNSPAWFIQINSKAIWSEILNRVIRPSKIVFKNTRILWVSWTEWIFPETFRTYHLVSIYSIYNLNQLKSNFSKKLNQSMLLDSIIRIIFDQPIKSWFFR